MSKLPLVLIHGGGFDARCWDLLLPMLDQPVTAVDLPGRGAHPMDLRSVSFADCANSVEADLDAAGFDRAILVGHSLAGCSMPTIAETLGDRCAGMVFLACTVPEDGSSAIDTLDPAVQELARSAPSDAEPQALSGEMAALVLGSDLSEEQVAWCLERTVAEAPRLSFDPVSLAPFREQRVPRRWIRTLRDEIVPAEKQSRFASNVGDCSVVNLDAGHMAMVSHPEQIAALLADPFSA